MRVGVAAPVLTFLMPLALGGGIHCVQDIPGAIPVGNYYVYNAICQPHCAFNTWIFEESNGVAGLQTDILGGKALCYPPWIGSDAIVL